MQRSTFGPERTELRVQFASWGGKVRSYVLYLLHRLPLAVRLGFVVEGRAGNWSRSWKLVELLLYLHVAKNNRKSYSYYSPLNCSEDIDFTFFCAFSSYIFSFTYSSFSYFGSGFGIYIVSSEWEWTFYEPWPSIGLDYTLDEASYVFTIFYFSYFDTPSSKFKLSKSSMLIWFPIFFLPFFFFPPLSYLVSASTV